MSNRNLLSYCFITTAALLNFGITHFVGVQKAVDVEMSAKSAFYWASEVAKREDMMVCSGFQSPLERDIIPNLLCGKIWHHRGTEQRSIQKDT